MKPRNQQTKKPRNSLPLCLFLPSWHGYGNDNDGAGKGGGKGQGIYYGGFKKADKCRGDGGGFAGPKVDGKKKGGHPSLGFTLEIGFEEFVAPPIDWKTVFEEKKGSGRADGFSFTRYLLPDAFKCFLFF